MTTRKAIRAKMAAGTNRPDRKPKNFSSRLMRVPSPPAHISISAAVQWRRLAPVLTNIGVLSTADLCTLALLCETLATEEVAREIVEAEGLATATSDGGLKPHPSVRIMETARAQVAALFKEFGLTPRSRAGVNLAAPTPAEENPFQECVGRFRPRSPAK